jgi:hypothetical protein
MPEKKSPLQRRISPSVPLTLELDDRKVTFRLSFDYLTLARIEDRTFQETEGRVNLRLVGNIFDLWRELSSAGVLGATFWAALLNEQPEYDSDPGYRAAVSFLYGENVDLAAAALAEAYPLFLSKDKAKLFRDMLKKVETGKPEDASDPSKDQAQETPKSSSTGPSSGPSPDTISGSAASASSAS